MFKACNRTTNFETIRTIKFLIWHPHCELPEGEMNNVYIPNPQLNAEFQFHQINVENIALALMNLKTNKSTGLDKIPAKVLKLTADIIAPSLTYIFNLSLATGIYVDDWKRARLHPVYKSDDKLKCEIIDRFLYCQ